MFVDVYEHTMVSLGPLKGVEDDGTDSGIVIETLSEYTARAHELTTNLIFGILTRPDNNAKPVSWTGKEGSSGKEKSSGKDESSVPRSDARGINKVHEHCAGVTGKDLSGSTSSSSSSMSFKGSDESNGFEGAHAVTKFAVLELFVRKGCSSPSPAAVSCMDCGKKLGPYINFGALVGHAKHCSRKDLHVCSICNKRFTRLSLYKKHIFCEHGVGLSDKEFSCASCGKGFQSESLLFKHLKRTKCGLNDGTKRKASVPASSCGDGSSSSSNQTKIPKKAIKESPQSMPFPETGSASKKCKTVALVNHSGHMDWLLSCNTLLCSESERGMEHGDDNHRDTKFPQVDNSNAKSTTVATCDHIHGVLQGEKGEVGERNPCPLGCEPHVYKDGNTQCERLLNATMVKHNDHWDYVVNDRLLHVYQDPGLGQVLEDHGSFEFLTEDLAFDW